MPAEESHTTTNPLRDGGGFSLRAVIFANGELKGYEAVRDLLQPDDLILAADGGSNHCRALGVTPAVLIGDLDSVTEDDLAFWKEAGTRIIQHNPDKDENDLELALLYAKEKGAQDVLILGGLGGRWDQTLANILLPAYEKLAGLSISFWDDGQWLYLHSGRRARGDDSGFGLAFA
jgi:thiamine pyrophosphokinase